MSIAGKIQSLISAANTATGESDTTLTDAVQTLVDGYGSGGTEITDGVVIHGRKNDADEQATEITIYGTTVRKWFANGSYYWYKVAKIHFADAVTEFHDSSFRGMGSQATFVDFAIPATVTSIGAEAFRSSGIAVAELPVAVTTIPRWVFCDCNKLQTLKMPGVTSLGGTNSTNSPITGTLDALTTVEIGSIGHTVTSCGTYCVNCKNSGLTITVHTASEYADAILANIRNGATNATIIIKDSTTGETLITSTPT